jgi:hypothetical protein
MVSLGGSMVVGILVVFWGRLWTRLSGVGGITLCAYVAVSAVLV